MTADAGVDHDHMDCSLGKIVGSSAENESSLKNILRLNGMTDINDNRF